MHAKEALKLILNRSTPFSKEIKEIGSALKAIGVDVVCYSVFKIIRDNIGIRMSTYSSDSRLIEYYLSEIDKVPENALLEYQKYPILNSQYFYPFDSNYLRDDRVRKRENHFGIKNAIALSLHDQSSKTTEMFWFQTFDKSPEWSIKQVNRLDVFSQFALFFRDQSAKLIKPYLLTSQEFQQRSKHVMSQSINEDPKPVTFNINNYHFGDPFEQMITKHEFIILRSSMLGKAAKQIAREFNISHRTVEKQLEIILSKSRCSTLKELKYALYQSMLFNSILLSNN